VPTCICFSLKVPSAGSPGHSGRSVTITTSLYLLPVIVVVCRRPPHDLNYEAQRCAVHYLRQVTAAIKHEVTLVKTLEYGHKSRDDFAVVRGIILVYLAVTTDLKEHLICPYWELNPCLLLCIWPPYWNIPSHSTFMGHTFRGGSKNYRHIWHK